MRKFLVVLCSVALVAGTMSPVAIKAQDGAYTEDGDYVQNPWREHYTTEAPTEAPTEKPTQSTSIVITSQPQSVTVSEGGSATYTVVATGTGLKYQWQYQAVGKTTWTNISGATSTSFTKTKATLAQSGFGYRCAITDANGNKAYTEKATVTVTAPSVSITSQPKNATVEEGKSATYSITATGSGLKYQWQYQAVGKTTWSNISGATSASFTKTNSQLSQSGFGYRCVVTDSSGAKVYSNKATLTVTKAASTIEITSQPQDVTIYVNDSATFTVTATGTGLKYQWQYQSVGKTTWTSISTAKAASFTKTNATAAQNGFKYRCVVSDASGNKVNSSAAVLTVIDPITITNQPKSVVTTIGESATYSVVATADTALRYQWQYQVPGKTYWTNISGATAASFTKTNAQLSQSGFSYRCMITDANGATKATNAATITVYTPIVIKTQPASVTVSVGASTTFTVVATGDNLTYQWQYQAAGKTNWTTISGATSASFTKSNAQLSQSGMKYRCIIKDEHKMQKESDIAVLTVK
ncbi:MAG: immunoglobulin domain-containing protein [Lachnospiraceae bacterium]|nr:immunoglobulin domain-containing protein [Lachnospiraceae bacterium]